LEQQIQRMKESSSRLHVDVEPRCSALEGTPQGRREWPDVLLHESTQKLLAEAERQLKEQQSISELSFE
jgi:hypothetical protein